MFNELLRRIRDFRAFERGDRRQASRRCRRHEPCVEGHLERRLVPSGAPRQFGSIRIEGGNEKELSAFDTMIAQAANTNSPAGTYFAQEFQRIAASGDPVTLKLSSDTDGNFGDNLASKSVNVKDLGVLPSSVSPNAPNMTRPEAILHMLEERWYSSANKAGYGPSHLYAISRVNQYRLLNEQPTIVSEHKDKRDNRTKYFFSDGATEDFKINLFGKFEPVVTPPTESPSPPPSSTPPPSSPTSSYSDTPPGAQPTPTPPQAPFLGTWSGPLSGEFVVPSRGWPVASYSGTLTITIKSVSISDYSQYNMYNDFTVTSGTVTFTDADETVTLPISSGYGQYTAPQYAAYGEESLNITAGNVDSYGYGNSQLIEIGGGFEPNGGNFDVNSYFVGIYDPRYVVANSIFYNGNVADQGAIPPGVQGPITTLTEKS